MFAGVNDPELNNSFLGAPGSRTSNTHIRSLELRYKSCSAFMSSLHSGCITEVPFQVTTFSYITKSIPNLKTMSEMAHVPQLLLELAVLAQSDKDFNTRYLWCPLLMLRISEAAYHYAYYISWREPGCSISTEENLRTKGLVDRFTTFFFGGPTSSPTEDTSRLLSAWQAYWTAMRSPIGPFHPSLKNLTNVHKKRGHCTQLFFSREHPAPLRYSITPHCLGPLMRRWLRTRIFLVEKLNITSEGFFVHGLHNQALGTNLPANVRTAEMQTEREEEEEETFPQVQILNNLSTPCQPCTKKRPREQMEETPEWMEPQPRNPYKTPEILACNN